MLLKHISDSKVHGANIGPIWVLSAPDGPHVGLMNLAIRDAIPVPFQSRKCEHAAQKNHRNMLSIFIYFSHTMTSKSDYPNMLHVSSCSHQIQVPSFNSHESEASIMPCDKISIHLVCAIHHIVTPNMGHGQIRFSNCIINLTNMSAISWIYYGEMKHPSQQCTM